MGKVRLGVIGASVFGKDLGLYLQKDPNVESISYFDDYSHLSPIEGCAFLGAVSEIDKHYGKSIDQLILGIGYNSLKNKNNLYDKLASKYEFYTFIHESCILAPGANVSQGSIILPGCILDTNAKVEQNSVLHIGVKLSHDSVIGSHSFIAPSVSISGNSIIGERCFVGINTTISNSIEIAPDVRLGAGSLVLQNINTSGLFVGGKDGRIRKIGA